jgi:chemotaxis signal transduction protein
MLSDKTSTLLRTESTATLSPVDALRRFARVALRHAPAAAPATAQLRYGVRTGGLCLLIPAGMVSEVVEQLAVHPMPQSAPWFRGLINLRGHLVPVFDLRTLLTGEVQPLERLVVLDRGERAVGIAADELPEAVDPRNRATAPSLPGELGACLRGAFLEADELWLEIDFDALFRELGARAGS